MNLIRWNVGARFFFFFFLLQEKVIPVISTPVLYLGGLGVPTEELLLVQLVLTVSKDKVSLGLP